MREKACDLVYLDSGRYMSLDNLRVFYWAIIIIPFSMFIMGIVSIDMNGIKWHSLFPFVSLTVWSLLYWIFVLSIQSKRIKKTFELRFFVNGITGLVVSSLFWIFNASWNLLADKPFLQFDIFIWMLIFYLVFSLIYVVAIIIGVHKGIFALIKKKFQTKTFLLISTLCGSLIPCSGVIGMYISRLTSSFTSESTVRMMMAIAAMILFYTPVMANINFVQYYYCKKYKITCDEYGESTSPMLERRPKKKKVKKGKLSLVIKILISVSIVFIGIICIKLFIKGVVQGLS